MQNIANNDWAAAIAKRISDEWSGNTDFPQDAELLRKILNKLFSENPHQCQRLVGTGIIEEDYFLE